MSFNKTPEFIPLLESLGPTAVINEYPKHRFQILSLVRDMRAEGKLEGFRKAKGEHPVPSSSGQG